MKPNKIKVFSILLFLLSLLLLTGCDDFNVSFTKISEEPNAEKIDFLLENNSGYTIQFIDYDLHIKRDNSWVEITPPGMESGYVSAYTLKSGKSRIITHKIQALFGKLEPGEYMIRSEYKCRHMFNKWTGPYDVSYQFSIPE